MNDAPEPLLLMTAPYAGRNQRVTAGSRYFWDSSVRTGEYVILQRTNSGCGAFRLKGVEYAVPEGQAFIAIVPEESSYYFPSGAGQPWEFTWLNFYGRLACQLCAELRERFGPVIALGEHSAAGVAFETMVSRYDQRTAVDPLDASRAVYDFLLEWTRELQAPGRARLDPVKTVLAICRARFREPIGTKELAAEVGLSREHLSRLFTEQQGVSPGRFLRGLRVHAAQVMMAAGNVPLQEVALRCGFSSTRALKRALEGREDLTEAA